MQKGLWLSAGAAALVPPLVVLALLSHISPLCPYVLSLLVLVPRAASYASLTAVVLCGIAAWSAGPSRFSRLASWVVWWAIFALAVASAFVLVPYRPCFAVALLALVGPALLYPLRMLLFVDVGPTEWFAVVWVAMGISALACFIIGAAWLVLGFPGREEWTSWPEPIRRMVRNHDVSWKCAFVLWTVPAANAVELGLVALLCWIRMRAARDDSREKLTSRDQYIVSSVKQLSMCLVALIMLVWISASMTATGERELNQVQEDMRDEVLALAFWTFAGLMLWVLDTIGPENLAATVEQSKVLMETKKLFQQDWSRAFVFLIAAFPIAVCAAGEAMWSRARERARRPLLQVMGEWRWTSVLVKAVWLGLLYVSLIVGVAKMTTVMLSMLNEALSAWPVFSVSAAMFVLGIAIFLFPASPGPPIYVIMGIVITSSARRQGWGFAAGIAWATMVTYAMRLSFLVCAQQGIGVPFSGNDAVRQAIGIHTPYMRAVEQILKEPGLSPAKVTLLIGGPDWPVAVLCGILRLPLRQTLLGTAPVLVQSVFPCVLAGALLLIDGRQTGGLAEVVLVIAGALQFACGVIAFYYVQEVLEKHHEKLSASRPEDAHLDTLAGEAAAQERAFWSGVAWDLLPVAVKVLLVAGFLFMQASLLLLAGPWERLFGVPCFQDFALTGSVDKDLGGSPWSIVQPLGWVALALSALSALTLGAFYAWASNDLRPETDGEEAKKEGQALL